MNILVFENMVVDLNLMMKYIDRIKSHIIFMNCIIYDIEIMLQTHSKKFKDICFVYIKCKPTYSKLKSALINKPTTQYKRSFVMIESVCTKNGENIKYKIFDTRTKELKSFKNEHFWQHRSSQKNFDIIIISCPQHLLNFYEKNKSFKEALGITRTRKRNFERKTSVYSTYGKGFIATLKKSNIFIDIMKNASRACHLSTSFESFREIKKTIKKIINL